MQLQCRIKWTLPSGVKVATENKRNFDEDVLIASKSMIGKQYGTNTLASQSGMTATGARRQIN